MKGSKGALLDGEMAETYLTNVMSRLAGGSSEIERDAFLAGVQVKECAALFRVRPVIREWPHSPGAISLTRFLYLDDIGTKGCQHLGTV